MDGPQIVNALGALGRLSEARAEIARVQASNPAITPLAYEGAVRLLSQIWHEWFSARIRLAAVTIGVLTSGGDMSASEFFQYIGGQFAGAAIGQAQLPVPGLARQSLSAVDQPDPGPRGGRLGSGRVRRRRPGRQRDLYGRP